VRDGLEVAAADAEGFASPAPEPGVYRVEARPGERTWIASNPVDMRAGA
jgi:hypothetical protein